MKKIYELCYSISEHVAQMMYFNPVKHTFIDLIFHMRRSKMRKMSKKLTPLQDSHPPSLSIIVEGGREGPAKGESDHLSALELMLYNSGNNLQSKVPCK